MQFEGYFGDLLYKTTYSCFSDWGKEIIVINFLLQVIVTALMQ